MPSLKDTKRRITSVKSTQKITRAMKLVSSSKYARANQTLLKSKPYGQSFSEIKEELARAFSQDSPFFAVREEKKILAIVVTSDRGLCGGMNSSVIKFAQEFHREKSKEGVDVEFELWGKKGGPISKVVGEGKIRNRRLKCLEKPTYMFAKEITEGLLHLFFTGIYEAIYLIFPSFKNALVQRPEACRILPCLQLGEDSPKTLGSSKKASSTSEMIFEPSQSILLDGFLRRQICYQVYHVLLESVASEQAARMTAMDNATNNADKVIKNLTIQYNRARQAAITKELIEITSGAEAL